MELIRISEQKLKIMLTPTDMCHFDLDADSFAFNNEHARDSFRRLLDELQDRIGFVVDDRRISVQYFPSRNGGCEMFISTAAPEARAEDRSADSPSLSKNARALQVHQGKRSVGSFRRDDAYRFDTLGALLSVCKRLLSIGYIGESFAYRDTEKHYYLLLSMRSSSPFTVPEEMAFIVEYGQIENPSMLRLYVKEHAELIAAPDAVHRLAPLA